MITLGNCEFMDLNFPTSDVCQFGSSYAGISVAF